jgi:hypothetical protein
MNTQDLERARSAISVVRQVFGAENRPGHVVPGSALEQEALLVAMFLLFKCVTPDAIHRELNRLDAAFADRLATVLVRDIDWDAQSWSG